MYHTAPAADVDLAALTHTDLDGLVTIKCFRYIRGQPGVVVVPRTYALAPLGFTPDTFTSEDPAIALRPAQARHFAAVTKVPSGIVNLATGGGKTVLALALAQHYGVKTLVVVDQQNMVAQWTAAARQFLPTARVGAIQGTTVQIDGRDIVVAMIQTLTQKTRTFDLTSFGLCVVDEVHVCGTDIRQEWLLLNQFRYLYGLTGTVARPDGFESVLFQQVGPVITSDIGIAMKQETEIHVYKCPVPVEEVSELKWDFRTKTRKMCLNHALMLNALAMNADRNAFLVAIIHKTIADPARFMLVISDRVAQLQLLHDALAAAGVDCSLMTGKHKGETGVRVILGSTGCVAKAFNVVPLNALLLATPKKSISQALGRIFRKRHDAPPTIIEIIDDHALWKMQFFGKRYQKPDEKPYIGRRRVYIDEIENPRFIDVEPDT